MRSPWPRSSLPLAQRSIEPEFVELPAIVIFQFALPANLSFQKQKDERVFSHPFELDQTFLWQGYEFRRGGVMSKVTTITKARPRGSTQLAVPGRVAQA